MKIQFKVSILIPVYNRENFIAACIQSALDQTYTNLEIIIVDNASTDNTWEILEKFEQKDSRVKIFRNTSNIGPVRNWKRCIDEASGEYGKILWSDDLIAPTFLEKTIPFLVEEDVGFVFAGTEIFFDGSEDKSEAYFIGSSGVYSSNEFIEGSVKSGSKFPVSPGCALFRLSDIKNNLLIDIPNKISSDFSMHAIGNDLLIFLLTANTYKNFAFVNEKLAFFRAHKGTISSQDNDGKLPLHYDIARAYFIELYRSDLINYFNMRLFVDLKQYKSASKYGLIKIEDFYMENKDFSFSYRIFLKFVFNFCKRKIRKIQHEL